MTERSINLRLRRGCGASVALLAIISIAQLLLPVLAAAHSLGPNYETVVRSVSPSTPGLTAKVDKGRGELIVSNGSTKIVTAYGYEREPYVRMLPDGRVFENSKSPAKYLNLDQYANTSVPKFASARAAPDWRLVASDGKYQWHDHRIHWMSPTPPRSVANSDARKKIFDWKVPLVVGSERGAVSGSLYWEGESKASPVASVAVFAVCGIVVLVGGLIWLRRTRETEASGDAGADPEEKQAW